MGEGAGDMDARAFNTLSQWFDRHKTRPSSSDFDPTRPVDIARTTNGLVSDLRRACEMAVGELGGDKGGLEQSQTLFGHEDGLVVVWSDLIDRIRPLVSLFSSTSRKIPRSAVALRTDPIGDWGTRGGVLKAVGG